jgi:hypothetical protein
MLDAEQLAADRAGEEILSDIRAKAGREDGERAAQAGRDERTSLGLGELGSRRPAARSCKLGPELRAKS